MTMPRDEGSRDPRLDAAWQAASREEPPPAIDSAIRAAARRDLQSGPHVIAEAQRFPRSRRRTWWPLAAAAAVAAITVGVIQTVPLEPNLTDTTAGARHDAPSAPREPTAPSPPGPMTQSPAPAVSPSEPPLPRDEAGQSARLAREPSRRVESTQEKPESGRPTLRIPPQLPRQAPPRERADSNAGRRAIAAQDSRSPGEARRQGAPSVMPPAAAGRIEPSSPANDGPSAFATSPAPRVGVAPQAPSRDTVPSASPDAAPRASPFALPSPSRAAEQADAQVDTAPLAKSTAAAERTSGALPTFDEWVKTIQQLLREGHRDDAQRETIRVRDAYPDREPSLPPELRALLMPR